MCSTLLRIRIANIVPQSYHAVVEGICDQPRKWPIKQPDKLDKAIHQQMQCLAEKWEALPESCLCLVPTFPPCDIVIRYLGLHKVKGAKCRHQIDVPDEQTLTSAACEDNAAVCYVWMAIPEWAGERMADQGHYDPNSRIVWMPCHEEKLIRRSGLRKGVNKEFERWWVDMLKGVGVSGISQKKLPCPAEIVQLLTPQVRKQVADRLSFRG